MPMSKSQKNPKFFSLLNRKLKTGKTYSDFRQAWLPPVENPDDPASLASYFMGRVQVISAQNVNDPSEIITIGLVWADQDEIQKDIERTAATERLRGERIAQVADKYGETKFYKIVAVDELGKVE